MEVNSQEITNDLKKKATKAVVTSGVGARVHNRHYDTTPKAKIFHVSQKYSDGGARKYTRQGSQEVRYKISSAQAAQYKNDLSKQGGVAKVYQNRKNNRRKQANYQSAKMRSQVIDKTLNRVSRTRHIKVNGKWLPEVVLNKGTKLLQGGSSVVTGVQMAAIGTVASTGDPIVDTAIGVAGTAIVKAESTARRRVVSAVTGKSQRVMHAKAERTYAVKAKKEFKADKKLEKAVRKYDKNLNRLQTRTNNVAAYNSNRDVRKLQDKVKKLDNNVMKRAQQKQKASQAAKKTREKVASKMKGSFEDELKTYFKHLLASLFGYIAVCAAIGILFIMIVAAFLSSLVMALKGESDPTALLGDAQEIYQSLQEHGLDDMHCAAALGVMSARTSSVYGDIDCYGGRGGQGFLDWADFDLSERGLEHYRLAYGLFVFGNIEDFQTPPLQVQLDYFWTEMYATPGAEFYFEGVPEGFQAFLAADNINDATEIFLTQVTDHGHDPADPDLEINRANDFYTRLTSRNGSFMSTIPLEQRMDYLFPNGTPQNESEMAEYLQDVPITLCDVNGNIRTASITCHTALAADIAAACEEMANMGFPVHDIYCYGWRTMSSYPDLQSHHSYGVALDINVAWNPATYTYTGEGEPHQDTSSPYYINPLIVQVWARHGFYWGGNWQGYEWDSMHFTYTNH